MASQSFRVKNSLEVGAGVTISSSGNITAGVLTATSFVGSGSQLTGIIASSGIATYAFVSGVSTSVIGGIASVTELNVSGISTFAGITTVTGPTLFSKQLNVSGVSTISTTNISGDLTFTGANDIYLKDSGVINIGNSNDLQIYHNGIVSVIREAGTGGLLIDSNNEIKLAKNGSGTDTLAIFTPNGSVELYYNNSKKFETSGVGATVYGTLNTTQLNVSGVSTFVGNINVGSAVTVYASSGIVSATSFSGDGSALTGIAATTNVITNSLVVSGVSTLGTFQVSSGIVTASSGIVTYYGDVSNATDGRWVLGANGSSHYTFTGIGFTVALDDPSLYLTRGKIYEFINTMGMHPFRIQSTVNGSTGTQFNRGVTNNDVSNGTLRFEVPMDAPSILYYQCTAHASMGGIINIIDGLNTVPQNAQTSAYVLVATDGGKHVSITTGGVTVPQNIFSIGDTVAIYNNSGSSQTITQGTGVTLRLSGTSSTGNRTLDQYGLCTILCVASNTFAISGSGLS